MLVYFIVPFLYKQNFKEMSNELKALRSKLTNLTHEVNVLQTQVLELNLKRPVVLSSSAPANRSSITVTAKPAAKRRGRPVGSKNKAKPKTKK
jgi:hypothetical protein